MFERKKILFPGDFKVVVNFKQLFLCLKAFTSSNFSNFIQKAAALSNDSFSLRDESPH